LPVALVMAPYVGVEPEVVMFVTLAAAGMPFLLLVGAAPNAVAYESNQFKAKDFFLYGIPPSIVLLGVIVVFAWKIWPWMGMPVLIGRPELTARVEDHDKIVGLELGADDYVTKPFNARELVARIRAVLRLLCCSGTKGSHDRLQVGRLVIDQASHTVTIAGRHVELTPIEFDLLATLAREQGRVFGREMLLERVWGYDYVGESRTVDVHVQRLRRKIELDPSHPTHILTVRGIGYKFAAEEEL